MPTYSIAKAKDNLSKLVDEAVAGEEVAITRTGRSLLMSARQPSARFGNRPVNWWRRSWSAPNLARVWARTGSTSFAECEMANSIDLF